MIVKRGDIYYADLSPVVGSEQGGVRPVLIVQNNVGNKFSPTVIAAAITSQINKAKMPTHIEIDADDYGLSKDSVILLEQVRTIDKRRLKERIGHLNDHLMNRVNEAIEISLGLEEEYFTFTVVPVSLMALEFFSVNVSDVLLSFGVSTFTTHLYVFLLTFA